LKVPGAQNTISYVERPNPISSISILV